MVKEKEDEEPAVVKYTSLLMVVVAAVGAVTALMITLQISPEKYASIKNEFFQQIERQIVLGILKDTEDVEMIRIGVSREKDSEKLRLDDLQGLLTEYLVWVSLDKTSREGEDLKKVEIVKVILKDVTSVKPFSILPEGDQLTAIELKNSIELGDKETALSRMELLTNSLGKEISSLKRKIESSWRWTIYGALIGGIGVLVTIVLSLLYRRVSLSREFGYLRAMLQTLRNEVRTMQHRMGPE